MCSTVTSSTIAFHLQGAGALEISHRTSRLNSSPHQLTVPHGEVESASHRQEHHGAVRAMAGISIGLAAHA
jgi:hypothetical protein